jgi:HPt (histidine-containing phosphotransfer) domain-containing protein
MSKIDHAELKQLPLLGELQRSRLSGELGPDVLNEFSTEFFFDVQKQWGLPGTQLLDLPEKQLRSLAHRYAGTAGTLGFPQIRQCFLNIQYADNFDHLSALLTTLFHTIDATKSAALP